MSDKQEPQNKEPVEVPLLKPPPIRPDPKLVVVGEKARQPK